MALNAEDKQNAHAIVDAMSNNPQVRATELRTRRTILKYGLGLITAYLVGKGIPPVQAAGIATSYIDDIGRIDLDVGLAPGTPGSGVVSLYAKSSDKKVYFKDDAGAETGPLGAGGIIPGSYVIYIDGATIKAVNGTTGVVDSNADAYTVINSVFGALTNGGLVFLRRGVYSLVSPLTFPYSNIVLMGEGYYGAAATILKHANTTDFGISGVLNVAAASAIYGTQIKNLQVDGNKANNTTGYGILYANASLDNPWATGCLEDLYVHDCIYRGINIVGEKCHAYRVVVTACGYEGWLLNDRFGYLINCHANENTRAGFRLSGAACNWNHLYGCTASHNGSGGTEAYSNFYLDTSAPYNILRDCMSIGSNMHGFYLNGVNRVILDGCQTYGNSGQGAGSADDIRLDGATYCIISKNRLYAGAAPKVNYGVKEVNACDYNRISENTFLSMVTGNILLVGANSKAYRNPGFVTENNGTATITAGNTTTGNVAHGLAVTPVIVNPVPTSDTGGKRIWVSSKDGTNFVISIDSAYSANITFDWEALGYV